MVKLSNTNYNSVDTTMNESQQQLLNIITNKFDTSAQQKEDVTNLIPFMTDLQVKVFLNIEFKDDDDLDIYIDTLNAIITISDNLLEKIEEDALKKREIIKNISSFTPEEISLIEESNVKLRECNLYAIKYGNTDYICNVIKILYNYNILNNTTIEKISPKFGSGEQDAIYFIFFNENEYWQEHQELLQNSVKLMTSMQITAFSLLTSEERIFSNFNSTSIPKIITAPEVNTFALLLPSERTIENFLSVKQNNNEYQLKIFKLITKSQHTFTTLKDILKDINTLYSKAYELLPTEEQTNQNKSRIFEYFGEFQLKTFKRFHNTEQTLTNFTTRVNKLANLQLQVYELLPIEERTMEFLEKILNNHTTLQLKACEILSNTRGKIKNFELTIYNLMELQLTAFELLPANKMTFENFTRMQDKLTDAHFTLCKLPHTEAPTDKNTYHKRNNLTRVQLKTFELLPIKERAIENLDKIINNLDELQCKVFELLPIEERTIENLDKINSLDRHILKVSIALSLHPFQPISLEQKKQAIYKYVNTNPITTAQLEEVKYYVEEFSDFKAKIFLNIEFEDSDGIEEYTELLKTIEEYHEDRYGYIFSKIEEDALRNRLLVMNILNLKEHQFVIFKWSNAKLNESTFFLLMSITDIYQVTALEFYLRHQIPNPFQKIKELKSYFHNNIKNTAYFLLQEINVFFKDNSLLLQESIKKLKSNQVEALILLSKTAIDKSIFKKIPEDVVSSQLKVLKLMPEQHRSIEVLNRIPKNTTDNQIKIFEFIPEQHRSIEVLNSIPKNTTDNQLKIFEFIPEQHRSIEVLNSIPKNTTDNQLKIFEFIPEQHRSIEVLNNIPKNTTDDQIQAFRIMPDKHLLIHNLKDFPDKLKENQMKIFKLLTTKNRTVQALCNLPNLITNNRVQAFALLSQKDRTIENLIKIEYNITAPQLKFFELLSQKERIIENLQKIDHNISDLQLKCFKLLRQEDRVANNLQVFFQHQCTSIYRVEAFELLPIEHRTISTLLRINNFIDKEYIDVLKKIPTKLREMKILEILPSNILPTHLELLACLPEQYHTIDFLKSLLDNHNLIPINTVEAFRLLADNEKNIDNLQKILNLRDIKNVDVKVFACLADNEKNIDNLVRIITATNLLAEQDTDTQDIYVQSFLLLPNNEQNINTFLSTICNVVCDYKIHLFTLLPTHSLEILEQIVTNEIKSDQVTIFSAFSKKDRTFENFQSISTAKTHHFFIFKQLTTEDKTLKNFQEILKMDMEQVQVYFSFPDTEQTLENLQRVLKLNTSQCTSFLALPEANKTASNLPTSPPARANFQDNVTDQRARVTFIPRKK